MQKKYFQNTLCSFLFYLIVFLGIVVVLFLLIIFLVMDADPNNYRLNDPFYSSFIEL